MTWIVVRFRPVGKPRLTYWNGKRWTIKRAKATVFVNEADANAVVARIGSNGKHNHVYVRQVATGCQQRIEGS